MRNPGEIDPEKMVADNNSAVGYVPPPAPGPFDAVLAVMAEDAFEVLNWARRQGMKRDGQCAQVVLAFKKTLTDTNCQIVPTAVVSAVNEIASGLSVWNPFDIANEAIKS